MKKAIRRVWVYILSGLLLIGVIFYSLKLRHDWKQLEKAYLERLHDFEDSVLYGPPIGDSFHMKIDSMTSIRIETLREKTKSIRLEQVEQDTVHKQD